MVSVNFFPCHFLKKHYAFCFQESVALLLFCKDAHLSDLVLALSFVCCISVKLYSFDENVFEYFPIKFKNEQIKW